VFVAVRAISWSPTTIPIVLRVDFLKPKDWVAYVDTIKLKGYPNLVLSIQPFGFGADFRDLVGSTEFADVVFQLDDGSLFPAHKAILAARSKYFRTMFTGGMQESTAKEVRLQWVSKEVFHILMVYLYSATADCEENMVLQVFEIADRYWLQRPRDFAEKKVQVHVERGQRV